MLTVLLARVIQHYTSAITHILHVNKVEKLRSITPIPNQTRREQASEQLIAFVCFKDVLTSRQRHVACWKKCSPWLYSSTASRTWSTSSLFLTGKNRHGRPSFSIPCMLTAPSAVTSFAVNQDNESRSICWRSLYFGLIRCRCYLKFSKRSIYLFLNLDKKENNMPSSKYPWNREQHCCGQSNSRWCLNIIHGLINKYKITTNLYIRDLSRAFLYEQ